MWLRARTRRPPHPQLAPVAMQFFQLHAAAQLHCATFGAAAGRASPSCSPSLPVRTNMCHFHAGDYAVVAAAAVVVAVVPAGWQDGETAAGSRLAHLLDILGVEDVVVVVSRWYGGIQLGADRFKHINNVARALLEAAGFIPRAGGKKAKPAAAGR
jgi:hypothetical protein